MQDKVLIDPNKSFQKALGRFLVDHCIKLMPARNVHALTPVARKCIESKDADVAQVWADVFLMCVKHMPLESITDQVLKFNLDIA